MISVDIHEQEMSSTMLMVKRVEVESPSGCGQ